MEELILHYYLKVFSISIFLLIFTFLIFFYVLNKELQFKRNLLTIEKNQKIEEVLKKNIKRITKFEIQIIKYYYRVNNVINKNFIHYGDFLLNKPISAFELLSIISKPTNMINKVTIVEGWSHNQLNIELSKHFQNFENIKFEDILADTYFFEKNKDFKYFLEKLKKYKEQYFLKINKNNEIINKYSINEILVIGSLIEKEGLDYEDKRKIASVIFNRLNKNMRLQIDATVLFAITNGEYNLGRKLTLNDLKYDSIYNTYRYNGLPPKPISYVSKRTLDIIFENYETDFLFYFFNKSLKRHIFSKTYNEHKRKLDEYRNNE